jgi:hypothetical protein
MTTQLTRMYLLIQDAGKSKQEQLGWVPGMQGCWCLKWLKSKNVNSIFEVSISTFIALIFPLFLLNLSSLENGIVMKVQFFLAYATHEVVFSWNNIVSLCNVDIYVRIFVL